MQPLDYRQTPETTLLSGSQAGAAERFDRVLGVRHYSEATRRVYGAAVRAWMLAGGEPGHIDPQCLARYLAKRRRDVSQAAINIDIKALRAFYRLQVALDACAPADLMHIPRQRRPPERVPRTLDADQFAHVLAAIDLDGFVGVRDLTIIRTLYESGLRASELARLEVGDVLPDGVIYVRRGKGGVDRYVPITESTQALLHGYLRARGTTRPGKRSALWVRDDGLPLKNGRSIWEIVSRRVWSALHSRAGFARIQRLAGGRPWQGHYPHELRASYATRLMERGVPIHAIQQLLGHANLATTAQYLAVDLEHLRRAISVHPRALARRPAEADPEAWPSPASGPETAGG